MMIVRRSSLKLIVIAFTVYSLFVSCSKKLQPGESPDRKTSNHSGALINQRDENKKKHLEDIESNLGSSLKAEINTLEDQYPRDLELIADKVIESAMEYLGVPHCMGGTTMKCLDCSGLVMIVFEEFGISLPHNAQAQSKYGTLIKGKNNLRKGDLVFFHGSYKTSNYITHSGIYAGDNKFIHTSSGKGVTITSMDDAWWKGKFAFGSRVIK